MRSALFCFCLGVSTIVWLPFSLGVLAGISAVIACSLVAVFGFRKVLPIDGLPWLACSALIVGLLYGLCAGYYHLGHRLEDCGSGKLIHADIAIRDLPREQVDRTSFDAAIVNFRGLSAGSKAKFASGARACKSLTGMRSIRLSWYKAPRVKEGQTWQVTIKLRAPSGFQNPGGFDYEAWMFHSRLDASGVIKNGRNITGDYGKDRPIKVNGLSHIRAQAREFFTKSELSHGGIMLALVTGESDFIPGASWDLFRSSGTIHLIVISGLHMSLIAAIGFFLGQSLLRLFPWVMKQQSARLYGVLGGLVCGFFYAALSGWNMPAQRAFFMLSTVSILYLLNRQLDYLTGFLVVVSTLLILDPLSPLAPGFWLSCGAVALILFYFAPRSAKDVSFASGVGQGSRVDFPKLKKVSIQFFKLQLVIFVGMLPLMWLWMGQFSWVAPLANVIAVPVISWVVVPLSLLSFALFVLGIPGAVLLQSLDNYFIEQLVFFLGNIDHWSRQLGLGYEQAGVLNEPGLFSFLVVLLSVFLLLTPVNFRIRLMLLSGMGLPFITPEKGLERGEFSLHVLDVGQGSAQIVDTAHHRLLFDTAAKYKSGFDLGEAVVLPAIRATGKRYLDAVVLSHPDNDHVGGFASIFSAMPVVQTYLGSPMGSVAGKPCLAGLHWRWDDVDFEFIHPSLELERSRNDQSCVLLVHNGVNSVLLTGDISKRVERRLLGRLSTVDVLVVAHHGSRTSSSYGFLKAVAPKKAIISAGYANRFGHPHSDVLKRINRYTNEIAITGDTGSVIWESSNPGVLERARTHAAPYWRVKFMKRGFGEQ